MRRFLLVLLGLGLFPLPALAQDDYPRGEIFVGYSYQSLDFLVDRDNGHGFEASGVWNPRKHFGIEGDFSGYFGNVLGEGFENYLILGGPRLAGRFRRASPFVHALFGVNHIRDGGASSTDFAMAYGGGVDVNASKHVAIRLVQADYVYVRVDENGLSGNSHNFRLSAGVTLKW